MSSSSTEPAFLDRLFAAARQEPPALSLDEVRQLVGTASPTTIPQPGAETLPAPTSGAAMTSTLTLVAAALLLATHPNNPALLPAPPTQPSVALPADTARTKTQPAVTGEQARNATSMPWGVFWDQLTGKDLRTVCAKNKPTPTPASADSVQHQQPTKQPTLQPEKADLWASVLPSQAQNRCGGACVLGVAGVAGQLPGVAANNLPDDVLAALGIRVENYVASYQHNVKGLGWINIAEGRNGAMHSNFVRVDVEPHPEGGPPMTVYPWYVTDCQGRITTTFQLSGEDNHKLERGYFNQVVNRLAPISVQTGNHATDIVVFWYEITPELLKILPQGTAQDLNCSYRTWLSPQTRTSAPATCPATKPNKLTEAGLSLYPNPARGNFNLEMQLPQELQLKVRLLDMGGREVMPLPNSDVKGEGNIKLNFPLEGVAPGIYLVQLETPDGQRWSRRLIVEK